MKTTSIIITSLALAVMAAGGWGYKQYLQKEECYNKYLLTAKVAKKASIKAKESDTRLNNLVHPDSMKVNPATGQTVLYLSNKAFSNNQLPALYASPADTAAQYNSGFTTSEKKYRPWLEKLQDSLNSYRKQTDSLSALVISNNALEKSPSFKAIPIPVADTAIRIKPLQTGFSSPYFIGGRQNEFNQLPDFSVSFRGAFNYSISRDMPSFGLGASASLKNTTLDGLLYYDLLHTQPATTRLRGVISIKQDIFRIFSVKHKK